MVDITPAILTDSEAKFSELLRQYLNSGFEDVDIDITEQDFVGSQTIDIDTALAVLDAWSEDDYASIGWDLMVADPKPVVEKLLDFAAGHNSLFRIYVHLKSDYKFLTDLDCHQEHIAVVVDGDEDLKGVDFYQKFPEVQFMGIIAGEQGRKFIPEVLDKLTQLRQMGYTGGIGIDGGVNLRSAELINAYAKEVHIDRVSVGSYFQKSDNIDLDYKKLKLALNL